MDWYRKSQEEILKELDSSITGLNNDEVISRREKYGSNTLPVGHKTTYLEIFINQFKSPLIYILLISATIVLIMGDIANAIVIGIVLILNAIIGTFQEGKAENSMNALKKLINTKATVLRENTEIIVDDWELVPGDVIVLREGDKIPADAYLISEEDLQIDESALTGESKSVSKNVNPINKDNLSPQDQLNMVFCGTYVVGGNAQAIIVATGVNTLIGKISVKLQDLDTDLPLKTQIISLSKNLIIIVSILVGLMFIFGLFVGMPLREMFSIMVAMAVSAIPEGLPVVVTLILATGVSRMTKRNALVKNLQAVEALGQADIIAVDKTGTITLNQMQVMEVCVASGIYKITGQGYEPKGAIEQSDIVINYNEREDLMHLGKIASLTAIAHIAYSEEKKQWQRVSGDPTEVALLVLSEKLGFNKQALEKENPKIFEIPFNSDFRYHATINTTNKKSIYYIAGAPEVLMDKSHEILKDGKNIKFTDEEKSNVIKQMKEMSSKGLRILVLAYSEHIQKNDDHTTIPQLVYVGFVGIEDAIRPEVYDAVDRAKKAGIKVVMITGDHVDTARAIAHDIGIYVEGDHILTDKDFIELKPHELRAKIVHTSVFARVTPDHKMAIINAYKDAGLIVAMTGDGVNDALSLAAADLGVAMGKMGTEVAKEAADIILLDDNFGSIVYAVEEGRNIYRTIRKVLMYILSTGLGEILTIFGFMILGYDIPFTASQIIWLNLVTDGFLVVALAFEPKDIGILSQKLQKNEHKLINTQMFIRMFIMGTIMMLGSILIFNNNWDLGFVKASTMSLTLLAAYQWFNAFNCRSDKKSIFKTNLLSNTYLIVAFISVIILQFVAIYSPFFNKFLHTTPMTINEWIVVIFYGLSIIFVDEIYKLVRYSLSKFK